MKSKYLGKIYDGRWKVIGYKRLNKKYRDYEYTLQNIYNKEKMIISSTQLYRIDKKGMSACRVYGNKKGKSENRSIIKW